VLEKILALLGEIEDESVLESIYWFIERSVVQNPPAK